MIEQGLYQFLLSNDAIDAVIPSTLGVFQGHIPSNANYPCVMFEKVSGVYDTTFDGPSGFVQRRYQFTCAGKDNTITPGSGYVSAQLLAEVLRKQMNGLTGTLPDGTKIWNCILDTDFDSHDEDGQVDHVIQDYLITFCQNP